MKLLVGLVVLFSSLVLAHEHEPVKPTKPQSTVVCELRTVDANLPPKVVRVPLLEELIISGSGNDKSMTAEGFTVSVATNGGAVWFDVTTPNPNFQFRNRYHNLAGTAQSYGFTGNMSFDVDGTWANVVCYLEAPTDQP